MGASGTPDPARRRLLRTMALAGACVAMPNLRASAPGGIDVIGAPSNLGLRPLRPGHVPGAFRAPAALRAHRLVDRLGARDRGDVAAPAYDPSPDPVTGYRNGAGLAAYTPRLAERIGASLDEGRFVLVLGGDCSVLLGGALALRRRGRHGLLFIDGHSDFYFPHVARPLTAAGMDLALATGHGPDALVGVDGNTPYFAETDTVVYAYRDHGTPDEVDTARFERAAFLHLPIERVRADGVAATMGEALRRLERSELGGFWIHVDVDVLDPAVMPAVDSPDPGGLRLAELEDALAFALASPRALGLELTIFDPDLDADGRLAERLVGLLERAFARAGRFGLAQSIQGVHR
ncbi:arginase [Dokdonella fugitiva]|uniref:Arginase n=2 Tax=Dokdonella fugitiva TaxID=328517 RepID=A0A4R2I9V3_9GAMM|nr:arginase [Dokdonella fugitiva]